MTIDEERKRAETTGVTIQKDKLVALIRGSSRNGFPVAKGQSLDYVLIPIGRNGAIER